MSHKIPEKKSKKKQPTLCPCCGVHVRAHCPACRKQVLVYNGNFDDHEAGHCTGGHMEYGTCPKSGKPIKPKV